MKSIFLCHSSKDKDFVRELHQILEDNGIESWIDEAEIRIGDSLLKKISEGIEKADYVAIVLSPNSMDSPWVEKELEMAINQEIKKGETKVLPLIIENCDIPEYIKIKKYGDFRDPQSSLRAINELLKILKDNPKNIEDIKMGENKRILTKKEMKISKEKMDKGEYKKFRKIYDDAVKNRSYGGMGLLPGGALKFAKIFVRISEDKYKKFRKIYDDAVKNRSYGGMGLLPGDALKFAFENI